MNKKDDLTNVPEYVLAKIRVVVNQCREEYETRGTDYDNDIAVGTVERIQAYERGSERWTKHADESLSPWPEQDWHENLTGRWQTGTPQCPETYRNRIWETANNKIHGYFGTYNVVDGVDLYSGEEQIEIQCLIDHLIESLIK